MTSRRWRNAAGVALALAIGFFLYRAALVVTLADRPATAICAEGSIPRPLFDALTGFPAGVVVSCANSEGQVAVQWGPTEVDDLLGHWARAALFGFGGAALALIVLWWAGRLRRSALQRRSGVLTSA